MNFIFHQLQQLNHKHICVYSLRVRQNCLLAFSAIEVREELYTAANRCAVLHRVLWWAR